MDAKIVDPDALPFREQMSWQELALRLASQRPDLNVHLMTMRQAMKAACESFGLLAEMARSHYNSVRGDADGPQLPFLNAEDAYPTIISQWFTDRDAEARENKKRRPEPKVEISVNGRLELVTAGKPVDWDLVLAFSSEVVDGILPGIRVEGDDGTSVTLLRGDRIVPTHGMRFSTTHAATVDRPRSMTIQGRFSDATKIPPLPATFTTDAAAKLAEAVALDAQKEDLRAANAGAGKASVPVNGRAYPFRPGEQLTYEAIVALAGWNGTPLVAWRQRHPATPERAGTLAPGQSLAMYEGLVISVSSDQDAD